MIIFSKRIVQVMSLFIFLLLFMIGVFSQEYFTLVNLTIIVLKAFIGYVIFWLLGIVISDILHNTVLHSMEDPQPEAWERGHAVRYRPRQERGSEENQGGMTVTGGH